MSRSATSETGAGIAWQRLLPSWPLLLGLLVFARLQATPLALLNDPDTYLHIAAGRWMLMHDALPAHDPFSHTLAGSPWVAAEWLAELVLAAVYQVAGWNGITLLAAASAAAAAGLLVHFLLRRLEPLPALIAAAAAAALLQPHLLARPHVLALPIFVLWAGLLLTARDEQRAPPFAALPLMLLWANLHASFLFGLALAVYLGAEAVLWPAFPADRRREARRWGGFLVLAVGAALLTPWGVDAFVQPVRLTLMPTLQATFTEWRSPDFRAFPALEMWLLGLLLLGFVSGLRLPPARLVLLLGLVHLTLQHSRHADLLAIIAPLALAAPLGRHLAASLHGQPQSRLGLRLAELARPPTLAGLMLTLALTAALALPTVLRPNARDDDAVTPGAAVEAAARLALSGPVLNAESFGGYLAFRGIPTFIDGRVEMYGDAFLARHYQAESGDPAALRELLARYHIAWTLWRRGSAAAAAMDHLPGWQLVYADAQAVIHRRIAAAPQ